jgi:hypothetical protein
MLSFHNLFNLKNSNGAVSKARAAAAAALSVALVTLTAPTMPAHAEQVEIVKYAQSGHWAIYADSTGGCFSITEFSAGTIIKIGFDGRDDLPPYLIVGGPRVSTSGEGQNYRTRAVFDNWNVFQGISKGGRTPAGRAFLELPLSPEFVAAFAKHNDMAIEVAGTSVTSLPLAGTYAAILQTISCKADFAAQSAKKPSQNTSGSRPATTGPRLSQF